MELWGHKPTPGTSYARIAYLYARPDSIDDHRGLMPGDMKIQHLPKREFQALGGGTGAKSYQLRRLQPKATAGRVEVVPMPLAMRLHVTNWQAEKGGKLKFNVPVRKGRPLLAAPDRHPSARRRRRCEATLDGKPLMIARQAARSSRCVRPHASPRPERRTSSRWTSRPDRTRSTLECVEPGPVGLDLIWVKPRIIEDASQSTGDGGGRQEDAIHCEGSFATTASVPLFCCPAALRNAPLPGNHRSISPATLGWHLLRQQPTSFVLWRLFH